ncbi:MAG: MlaD family protein [Planctomycetota bacterium]|jgi:phospholipid/cholesterol/gamma-HCH transport system substrate-binding protein/paraquat-inducible protein B
MSTKPNYFKIGLFIIISVTLIVVAVVIWGAGLFTKEMIYFETYFDSSVSGLNPGAPVELMGVKIGQVERIEFASAVYDISTDPATVSRYERYVRVLCFMEKEESKERVGDITDEQREARTGNLIQQGLRLRLTSNILTGQAYLEGVFLDPERFPLLDITWEPKYMYVPSAPGTFSTIKDSVDEILAKLEEVDITGLGEEIKGLFGELRQTNQQIQELLTNPDPNAESTNLAQIMVRLDNTLEDLNLKIRSQSPEVDKFLRNLSAISDDIKELTAMLKEHPSAIIFSQPPAKSEIVK